MSLTMNKHPNDMDKNELLDALLQFQKLVKRQDPNKPNTVYTKTTLPKGQTPTADDIHEEAARKLLTPMYENQQNAQDTAAPVGKQVAESIPQTIASGVGSLRDKTVESAINKIITGQELQHARDLGRTGIDAPEGIRNNPKLFEAFKKGYNEFQNMTPQERSKVLKKEAGS